VSGIVHERSALTAGAHSLDDARLHCETLREPPTSCCTRGLERVLTLSEVCLLHRRALQNEMGHLRLKPVERQIGQIPLEFVGIEGCYSKR